MTARTALVWTGGILAAAFLVSGGQSFADAAVTSSHDVRSSYAANQVHALDISTTGDIQIETDPSATEVSVLRTDTGGFTKPSVTSTITDGTLKIDSRCEFSYGLSTGSCGSRIEVRLPADMKLQASRAHTSSGRVEVQGFGGTMDASSNSGDIEASDVTGSFTGDTGSGKVVAHTIGGSANLHSNSGDIDAQAVSGSLTGKTGSGKVVAQNVGGSADLHSNSGDVSARTVGSDASATTASGWVEVTDAGGNITARSNSGDVTVTAPRDPKPVALSIDTNSGKQRIEAPTDPAAATTVSIHSASGNVSYLSAS